jgi:hypothetical protein
MRSLGRTFVLRIPESAAFEGGAEDVRVGATDRALPKAPGARAGLSRPTRSQANAPQRFSVGIATGLRILNLEVQRNA